jgi:hypothetical protein
LKLPRADAKNKKTNTNRQAGAGLGRVVATPYAPKARKAPPLPPRETGDPPITGRRDNSRCPQPPPGDNENDITEYDQRFNPAGDRTTLLESVDN